MAKIRVAQIKDLSLTTTDNGKTITIGDNSIIPLENVAVAEVENSVITALAQSGNNLTATRKTFADIVSGGLVLTPAAAETGVITSLTKSGNTLTAVYTNNNSALTATSLTVMSGYTQDTNGKITATTIKSFNDAQFAETGNVISLHPNVLNASTYTGTEAIEITTLADGTKQVALTIDTADQVLTQSATGLKANLGLTYDSASKQIRLTGKTTGDGEAAQTAILGTIDATNFIKDGMLEDAEIITATNEEGLVAGKRYIKFTFKTYQQGQEGVEEFLKVEYLDVESLIDSYTQGNEWIVIDQTANTISHKTSTVTAGTYANNTADVTVDSTDEQSFKVPTFTVDAAGHVTAAGEKTVTITLPASIDTAIQGGAGVDTTYIETEVDRNATSTSQLDVTVTAKIGTFSNSETGLTGGLATTTAVEAYVEDYVANNAATQMKREVITYSADGVELTFVPEGDVAITQNGIDLNPGEYTVTGKNVAFTIDATVGIDDEDVFVAYYMYNPNTQNTQAQA